MMRASFVIDASVIIAWRDPREQNSYSLNILRCLNDECATAPVICGMEVNNVLRQFEKRGFIALKDIQETVEFISALPIHLDSEPVRFKMPRVMRLARQHDLTIYDACYLELALRLDLPLATMDNALRKAVQNTGFSIYGEDLPGF
jgi:predicted nucleic acid-binding protein